MTSRSAKRILLIGARGAGTLDVVRDLTGTAPTAHALDEGDDGPPSTAGLTHEWRAKTAYYDTTIPIWIDEFANGDVAAWQAEFLRPEAAEVVQAVGAWVYVFRASAASPGTDGVVTEEAQAAMKRIKEVVEKHDAADAVLLAVAMPAPGAGRRKDADGEGKVRNQEDEEDRCLEHGFEFIDYVATGANQFGEKVGPARLQEALEANEWTTEPAADEDEVGDDEEWLDGTTGWTGTDREEAEWTAEFFGVKAALHHDDEDDDGADEQQQDQVEDLDRLMGRLMAVREQSAGLPDAERRRLAARAVRDAMNGM